MVRMRGISTGFGRRAVEMCGPHTQSSSPKLGELSTLSVSMSQIVREDSSPKLGEVARRADGVCHSHGNEYDSIGSYSSDAARHLPYLRGGVHRADGVCHLIGDLCRKCRNIGRCVSAWHRRKGLQGGLMAFGCALWAMLFASCDRRPLEVYWPDAARIRIDVDWQRYFSQKPTGMTLLFYPESKNWEQPQSIVTNSVDQVFVDLKPDVYRVILFNQSVDEFGSMRFEDMQSYDKAVARARNMVTRVNEAWDDSLTYMTDPELLGVALDTIVITEDMLEQQVHFASYHDRHRYTLTTDTAVHVFQETVRPLTTQIYVLVHVNGIHNMRSMEGNITGLADGCALSQIWRTEESRPLLLDAWSVGGITRSVADSISDGWCTCVMPTWGLPHGKELLSQREREDNLLTLCFTLRDNTTRVYQFPVGQLIHYKDAGEPLSGQPWSTLRELEVVVDAPAADVPQLPEVIDVGGGSGFDARVADWEDGGTFNVGM